MTSTLPSPLGGPPPSEAPLVRSPLVRVIAQVRFARVLKIDSPEGVVPFQEAVRQKYPLLEQVQAQQFMFGMGGAPGVTPVTNTIWRFNDAGRTVTLSLTSDSATLEAQQYEGRDRFLLRLEEILAQVGRVFEPGLALRIGARYVNRIESDSLDRLGDWVEPHLVGVALPEIRAYVSQALSEAQMTTEEGALTIRWGVLPPDVTIDPVHLPPAASSSWILDIDSFSTNQRLFQSSDLAIAFRKLSERAYSMFRWAITPAGLTHFGRQE